MRRTSFRAVLSSVLVVLSAAIPAVAQDQANQEPAKSREPAKDPWAILDGTYYRPGDRIYLPGFSGRPEPAAPAEAVPEPAVPAEAVPEPQEDFRLKGEWSALAATYRQSLERLGEEDRGGLLRVVADVEVAAIAGNPERRMPRLARVELNVARQLAKQDPEILVPIFQLHHDLYLEHRKDRKWYLLHHTIAMVKELTALYVKETGSQGARINAARMLASLAGYLQAAQQPSSLDLFEEVLELDPTNESAYLGLAAHYEKRAGPFESVVLYLEQLLEVYPEHREARLRLAVNRLRLNDEKEAAELFRGLLDEPSTDWVYRLAAQEMARYEAQRGRLGEAIRVLEKAIANAPGDQKLCIQLSFLYDKNRQSVDATRIAKLASIGEPAPEPPRGRYNMWPYKALEQDREELRRLAANRVQLLAHVLNQVAPPEEKTASTSEVQR